MDWFLLVFLIPLILVPIVLLCGFAGCAQIADLGGSLPPPPADPSDLVAKTSGTNRVNLSWRDNTGGTANFQVYRAIIGPGAPGALSPVGGERTGTFFADNGLAEGTTFLYQVKAVDSFGQHSTVGSNFAEATTFRTAEASTWHTAFEVQLTTKVQLTPNGGEWANTCMVQRIGADKLNFGGTKVRITLLGSTASDFVIDKVSISLAASGSQPWQSIESPAAVPANGPPGVTLTAGTPPKTLDPVDYVLDPTKDLIIAFDINVAGGGAIMAPGMSECDFYFLENTHQATAKPRSSGFGNNKKVDTVYLVEKIEVL
jgi:hypothetical protein